MKSNRKIAVGLVLVLALALAGCPKGLAGLATASDAVAHSLKNAQEGVNQGVQTGVITPAEAKEINEYLSKVAQAGLVLDQGIRAGEQATSISLKVNAFMDTFNALQNQGLVGIKNPQARLAIATAINGAEAAVAVIAAKAGK